ncbi:reticulon isoform X2 [Haemaphysalis longicornis]
MDFLSDAAPKPHLDSGDESPNAPKPFVAGSAVDALSEDLAQFATGSGVTDAARSAVSSASPLTSGGAPAKPDHLDLLSDSHPDAGSPTYDSSPALKPALEPFSSNPGAEHGSSRDDLLGDSLPATVAPSAPAPDKAAPEVATGAPNLEAPQLKPVKSAAESFVDVKPTLPPASRPKASEMTAEPSSTTGSSRASPCCGLTVEQLVYWRQPKKSGLVFGAVLALLLSLTCFSLISVVAYLALGTLTVAIAFRVYRNVLQAVQKSSEGHPFKEYLEKDLSLPKERVHETVDTVVKHAEELVKRLRSLFLVEDLVDSLKLALLFWVLTYVGSWFNGMTLIILAYVAAFTLPKVYETYQAEIDQYLGLARTHVGNVMGMIRSKIPIGHSAAQAQRPKAE